MKHQIVVQEKQGKVSLWQTAVGTGAMVAMGSAHAEIGVSTFQPIITMITGLAAVVSAVGMAVLTVYATGKVFKWVKTALSCIKSV